MSNTSITLKAYKGLSTISRGKFGPGMLLQHEDLEQLNSYTRDLSRLLFRSFFGCGVICGLKVSATETCGQVMVTVDAGLALNCIGDPIYVPKGQTFAINDECGQTIPNPLWVVLCTTTKCCAPRTPVCGCDDDGAPAACTREVDGFEIRIVRERPECACGCPEPKPSQPTNPGTTTGNATAGSTATTAAPPNLCWCADPTSDCYKNHYAGICDCDCPDSNCVLLARLDHKSDTGPWTADHSVRRFIRPVLMRDPLAQPSPPAPPETVQPASDQGAAEGGADSTETKPKKKKDSGS